MKKYNWPISMLSIDWVRSLWGAGAYQANWIVEEAPGKLTPRGRSRTVELDDVGAPARARHAPEPAIAFGHHDDGGSPAPLPLQAMPPEVVDMRVRAAEEIASMRIKSMRAIHDEQIEWERRQANERFQRLEERINDLADGRRLLDDDDDEPGEWDWLKDLAQQFAPALKEIVPEILRRFSKPGLGA